VLQLAGLTSGSGKDVILTAEEPTYEEVAVNNAVRAAVRGRATLKAVWSHTMYHIDDVVPLYGQDLFNMPDVFTPYRKEVENSCSVRALLPAPKAGDLPLPSDLEAPSIPRWEELPLAASVVDAGVPKSHKHTALDFQVWAHNSTSPTATGQASVCGAALSRVRGLLSKSFCAL
jgi:deoxyribodipyrimidine photo-lyase